jgi:uncharacterized protein HemX
MMGTTIPMTSRQIDETTLIESSTSSSTTNAVESTTVIIAMPATTQPSDDNIALIGGVVGGVVALLIVVGVIAFLVSRNRRKAANSQQRVQQNDVSMAPAQASASNYGRINVQPASSQYDESFLKHSPATQHNDDAGVLTTNNYGIGNIASD